MKKYLLFTGSWYESCGGLWDYHSAYPTLEDAFDAGDKLIGTELQPSTEIEWYQILDCDNPDGFYYSEEHIKTAKVKFIKDFNQPTNHAKER
jgi:hypothetical protein